MPWPLEFLYNYTVDKTRKIRNLALVGFMGTGKTSVGHLVAGMLRFQFVDTDELIERKARKRITEIFAQDGEARFREYELEIVQGLEAGRKLVIATGGGVAVNPANMASLKAHALVICLWASPEAIFHRVRYQSNRPLLQDPDPLAKIRRLLAERQSFYREADVLLSSEFRSARDVAASIIHQFRLITKPIDLEASH